jgi:hypothetical protein
MIRVIILTLFLAGCSNPDMPNPDKRHIMCDLEDKTAWIAKHNTMHTWFFNRIPELDEKCK